MGYKKNLIKLINNKNLLREPITLFQTTLHVVVFFLARLCNNTLIGLVSTLIGLVSKKKKNQCLG